MRYIFCARKNIHALRRFYALSQVSIQLGRRPVPSWYVTNRSSQFSSYMVYRLLTENEYAILAKGQCSLAGIYTVGLASHRP